MLIFLGIPLLAGYLTRRSGNAPRAATGTRRRFLPRIGPFALYGLLFTIVMLFALQGDAITSQPLDVARIALPLLVYFAMMWAGSFALGRAVGLAYERTTTLAFTAAGNNFELAIAVAIATFGVTSGQALAGVVGPLIEVPVLVALVYVLCWPRRRRWFPAAASLLPRRTRSTERTGAAMTETWHRSTCSIDQRLALKTAADEPAPASSTAPSASRRSSGSCTRPTTSSPVAPRVHQLPAAAGRAVRPPTAAAPWPRWRAMPMTEHPDGAVPVHPQRRPLPDGARVLQPPRRRPGGGLVRRLRARRSEVNPAAVAAMAERGIDISTEFPKPWTDEVVRAADVVITMGCGDACPVFPGKRYEEWVLDDPAGLDLESTSGPSATKSNAASAAC